MKKLVVIFSAFFITISLAAYSHPGRLDANGGHYDRKTGQYHYHQTPKQEEEKQKPQMPKTQTQPLMRSGRIDNLIIQLKDQDASIRGYAALSLGQIGSPKAVESLIAALSDQSEFVRENAATALGEIGDKSAISELERVSKEDKEESVSDAAKKAVEKILSHQKLKSRTHSPLQAETELRIEPRTQKIASDLYLNEDFSYDTAHSVLRVIGNNTVEIQYEGMPTIIRLIGVDTPKVDRSQKPVEEYGKEAFKFIGNLLLGESVYLRFDVERTDKDGHLLAYLFRAPDKLFINLEIVRQGYGSTHTDISFKHVELFKLYEKISRESSKGVWSDVTTSEDSSIGASQHSTGIHSSSNIDDRVKKDDKKVYVYVSRTGKKYHREGCRSLKSVGGSMTKQEAEARGYTACSICKP